MAKVNEGMRKDLMGQIPLEKEFRGLGALQSVFHRLLHAAARYLPMYPRWRVSIHRIRGVRIGKGVFIGSDVFLDNTYPESIVIEDYVTIISRSFIIGHSFAPLHLKSVLETSDSENQGILIKKGAYIGAQSIVMPGVTIGQFSIVGAGSVVTSNIPSYSVAVGSPASVTRMFHKRDVDINCLS